MLSLLKSATKILKDTFDIEIIEKHHNQKVDAPSGTALMMAQTINQAAGGDMQYIYDRHPLSQKRAKDELRHTFRPGRHHCRRTHRYFCRSGRMPGNNP